MGRVASQAVQGQRDRDAGNRGDEEVQDDRGHHDRSERRAVIEREREDAQDAAPQQAVDGADRQFLTDQAQATAAQLVESQARVTRATV